jgi:hypothetical protein
VQERRGRERRVLYVGLAISLALHIVLIAIAGRLLDPDVVYVPELRETTVVEPERGIRVVGIVESEVAEAMAPEPVAEPVRPAPRRPQVAPPAVTEDAEAAPERRTAAERLAPRVVDPRLWRPMIVLPREPSFEDVQARVAAAIEMLSDSALAETERAIRSRDWTVEDAKGGRWGVSPGKLHLGSLTLPLPLYFPVDMEEQARQAYWFELETQLQRAEFLENFDSRVRSIRERRDRERSEGRPSDNSGRR